jgi:hypothetical protein
MEQSFSSFPTPISTDRTVIDDGSIVDIDATLGEQKANWADIPPGQSGSRGGHCEVSSRSWIECPGCIVMYFLSISTRGRASRALVQNPLIARWRMTFGEVSAPAGQDMVHRGRIPPRPQW